jgi:hypothetical protein
MRGAFMKGKRERAVVSSLIKKKERAMVRKERR